MFCDIWLFSHECLRLFTQLFLCKYWISFSYGEKLHLKIIKIFVKFIFLLTLCRGLVGTRSEKKTLASGFWNFLHVPNLIQTRHFQGLGSSSWLPNVKYTATCGLSCLLDEWAVLLRVLSLGTFWRPCSASEPSSCSQVGTCRWSKHFWHSVKS